MKNRNDHLREIAKGKIVKRGKSLEKRIKANGKKRKER